METLPYISKIPCPPQADCRELQYGGNCNPDVRDKTGKRVQGVGLKCLSEKHNCVLMSIMEVHMRNGN
jgi:hypothetical protein